MLSPSTASIVGDVNEKLAGATLVGVLQSIGEGLIVEDGTGRILWANAAAASMAGVASPEELVGSSLGGLRCRLGDEAGRPIDPGQLPGARLLRGEAAETTVMRLHDRENGRVSWVSVRASLIHGPDERARLAVSVLRDVTAERQREEAACYLARATVILSESIDYGATLKRLACVLLPDMADWYTVDVVEGSEMQCIAVDHYDPAKVALACEVHQASLCRLDDQTGIGAVVRTGRPEFWATVDAAMLLAYSGGDAERLAKLRALAPISMMIVPLKVREQTFGAMKLVRSAPGRRYDDSDLACAEELGRRVGIAIENSRAHREAREAIRLRDEFLTIAGHELRTPLTALKLQLQAVDVALRRDEPPSPAELSPRVGKTLAYADRLQQLIERLLDVSHITSRRLALDCQETDLAELWRAVIDRHRPDAARSGSVVSFTSTGATVGSWDRARIDDVLESLLGNALKYGKGKPVQVSLHGEDGIVRTLVQDEGIGIDLSAHSRMFGRFERAVSVRNYGGFGLGLWIVRELVEAHGGRVGFESRPGRGSTFWVELPTVAGPA